MPRRRLPSLWVDRPDDWPDDARGAHARRQVPPVAPEQPTAARIPPPTPRVPRPPQASPPSPFATREQPRPATTPAPGGPDGDGPAPGRRRRVATVAVVAALAGTAGAVGMAVLDDGDPPRRAGDTATAPPLPAAGGTVKPSSIAKLYAQSSRAVVSVRVRTGRGAGSGTGFLIDRDGTIVTNSHVVDDASTVQLVLDDGRDPVTARVRGTDPSTDLAVVKVDASDVAGITPLELAESANVRVGDRALAIGYPLGLDRTATSGIISGLGREIEAPNGFRIDEVIQTDAPINPGNSGGPLLDAGGRVIGVNSQIATAGGGGGNVGIGFAVPSDTVRQIVPRLLKGEKIERPYLGVSTADPLSAGTGATVATVSAGGPADRGGLRVGDTITEIDGQEVDGSSDVASSIAGLKPGDEVDIRVRRRGELQTLRVTLGVRPDTVP